MCKVSRVGTEEQDIREMKRLLQYANYRKVGEAIGVKRATVSNWARGIDVSPARLIQVRELMLITAGRRKRAAAPDLPGRLDEILGYLRLIARGVPVKDEDLAAIEELHHGVAAATRNGRPPGAPRRKAGRRPPGT